MRLTSLLNFLTLSERIKMLLSPNIKSAKISSTAPKFKCHICNKKTSLPFVFWDFDKSISSDCKLIKSHSTIGHCLYCKSVVKKTSPIWKSEVSTIYNNYSIYSDSGGTEKVVFDSEQQTQRPRSEVIIETLKNKFELPQNMKVLDIGTGSGVFLKAANKNFASANLFGHDINDNFMSELETIPNFKEFFCGNIDKIQTKFELISLIHVLEHVQDPIAFLKKLKLNLTKDGYLIVNVPDSENNPIDLAIYDHCTHFETKTLINVLGKAGFEVCFVSNKKIPREIVIIAKLGKYKTISNGIKADFLENNTAYLKEMFFSVNNLRTNFEIDIFGSSLASIWLADQLSDWKGNFVDEDKNKYGNNIFGKQIISPCEVKKGSNVFIPLEKEISKKIAKRLSSKSVTYHYTN